MASYTAFQGHNLVFLCFLYWKCIFTIICSETTSVKTNNSIAFSEELTAKANETQTIEPHLLSLDNSTVGKLYRLDNEKNMTGSSNVKDMQTSYKTSINNSVLFPKYDRVNKSNLRDIPGNEMTNNGNMIQLTTVNDKQQQFDKGSIDFVTETITVNSSRRSDFIDKTTYNLTDSRMADTSTKQSYSENLMTTSKHHHKILKHLSLVPIEDEPFGGVLWKNNSKYAMSICIPIGVGIAGAACIIGMGYAARRCYKNERKIQEIRAALQQQISANRTDETVLLESSDDEM